MIMGDTTLHNPAVNWRKVSTHAPYKEITWSISGKVIGKLGQMVQIHVCRLLMRRFMIVMTDITRCPLYEVPTA